MSFRLRAISPVLASAVFFLACEPMRASIPPNAAAGESLEVKGRKSGGIGKEPDFQIGTFAITAIDRDWNKSSSTGVGPWKRDASKRAYRFEIAQGELSAHAECLEIGTANSVGPWGTGKVTYTCECRGEGVIASKLEFVNGNGTFSAGTRTMPVVPIFQSEGKASSSSPLGYSFAGDGYEGAVDVSGAGRAFLPAVEAPNERMAWVCAYASLLLYRK